MSRPDAPARFVAVWTLALAAAGAGLAVAAIGRAQLPLLDATGRVLLVVRWAVIGALAGMSAGAAISVLAGLTTRLWLRRALEGAAVLALAVPVLLAARSPGEPWPALGPARDYPPLPERRARPDAPNLVLLTVDTLRRDHLELYGYTRRTAPHLAAFAAGGTVFEVAIAQAPETLRSLGSLVTGLYPHALDKEFEDRGGRGAFLGSPFHTLAERLAAGGYDTAAFVSNVYLRTQNGFAQGFRLFDARSGMFWAGAAGRSKRAEHVVEPALAWLESATPPFFLWVHVMDPHHPYEPPAAGPWEDTASPHAAAYGGLSIDAYTRRLKDLRAGRRVPADGEVDYLVGRYDAEILHADRQIARLLERLAARGAGERGTVLVVTADHGEEFGDHGGMLHGHTLFDELIRVPLVMRGKGIPAGSRLQGQVQLVDVTATLLDLAGVVEFDAAGASPALDGRTLLPALADGHAPRHPALSFRDTHYVAYRTPDWKLVTAFTPYEAASPSWIPWEGLPAMAAIAFGRPHRPHVGLWRLDADARERHDLAPAETRTLRALYATQLAHRRAHPPRRVASATEPGPDRRGREALRALGYVD